MKKIYFLLMICCATIACKKVEADFSFSPETPRAGESVAFTNTSTGGEEWEWQFGDGATTTLKSPTHTYKKPGTYTVTLKVDKKNSRTRIKDVVVVDTIPTFTCSDSTYSIFQDYTFTAQVYNPYNYEVKYQWSLPLDSTYAVVPEEDYTSSTLKVYFTRPLTQAPVSLILTMNDEETTIEKTFTVQDAPTNAVLFRTPQHDYRQRIFGSKAEQAKEATDTWTQTLLDFEQDTFQYYNGHEFYLSEMKLIFPDLEGFQIASRKFYYRASDGLWVANIDGAYPVQIDGNYCDAMTLDRTDNRIYWANSEGIWYMPFVGSDNNQFITTPTRLNTFTNVTNISTDEEKK